MAKLAGYIVFLSTILFGSLFGSQLILLLTDNWYIREAVYYEIEDVDQLSLKHVDDYEGNANAIVRDSMMILIAACLAAVVYALFKQQYQKLLKWRRGQDKRRL